MSFPSRCLRRCLRLVFFARLRRPFTFGNSLSFPFSLLPSIAPHSFNREPCVFLSKVSNSSRSRSLATILDLSLTLFSLVSFRSTVNRVCSYRRHTTHTRFDSIRLERHRPSSHSGATGNFISSKFAADAKLVLTAGPPSIANLANGQSQDASGVACGISLRIDTYIDRIDFNVTELGHYDVILGMAWLEQYSTSCSRLEGKSVSFVDSKGKQHRLRGASTGCARWNPSTRGAIVGPSLNVISLRQVERLHRDGQLDIACVVYPNSVHQLSEPSGVPPPSVPARPSAAAHVGLARRSFSQVVSSSSDDTKDWTRIHDAMSRGHRVSAAELSAAVQFESDSDAQALKLARERTLAPYADVFPDNLPAGLPPSREVDHRIELIPGSTPPSRPTIVLSATELAELKKQLIELEAAGVRDSTTAL